MAKLDELGLQRLVENIDKSINIKINGIKDTLANNVSYIEDITEWTFDVEEGVYKHTITHPLNTDRIDVTAIDTLTKERVFIGDQAIDKNTVIIKSDAEQNITVMILNCATEIKALEIPFDNENTSEITTWSSSKIQEELDKKPNDALSTSFDNGINGMSSTTVQGAIEENNTSIKAIESEFDKPVNSQYSTVNGIKEFECKQDGYLDNIVIEGKTLVNIAYMNTSNINGSNEDGNVRTRFIDERRCKKGNYTVFNLTDKSIFFVIGDDATPIVFKRGISVPAFSSQCINVEDGEIFYGAVFNKIVGWSNSDLSIYNSKMFMVFEGDCTQYSLSYFEGLKSVGQDDKIEVLTRETNKTNLLKSQNITYKDNYMISYATGLESASSNHKYTETYIEIESDTDYCFYHVSRNMCWYDSNKTLINSPLNERTFGIDKDLFYSAKSPKNAKYLRVTIIKDIHNNGETSEIYKGKYDKKQISTTLRSLPNGVKDEIVKQGDKYYKIKRCEEIILNGLEDWKDTNGNDNCISAYISLTNASPKNDANIFSDKLLAVTRANQLDTTVNSVAISGSKNLAISIVKTSLSSADVIGIKSWLSTNQVTIVYELEAPVIEELPNFNPRTFNDKTTLLINSGMVQADCNFEATNSLRSELEVLKAKTSDLDNYVVDEEVYSPLLLNGFTGSLKFVRQGKIVSVTGFIRNASTVKDGTIIFSLPNKFIPIANIDSSSLSNQSKNIGILIKNTGMVEIWDTTNFVISDKYKINISYSLI